MRLSLFTFFSVHFNTFLLSPHDIDCKQTWCKKIVHMNRASWLWTPCKHASVCRSVKHNERTHTTFNYGNIFSLIACYFKGDMSNVIIRNIFWDIECFEWKQTYIVRRPPRCSDLFTPLIDSTSVLLWTLLMHWLYMSPK